MKKFFALSIIALFLASCADQTMAKNFGGSAEINVTKGQKVVNVTWKEDDIWVLTKPMSETDSAEVYTFTESSSLGIMEGSVTIREEK